MRSLVAGVLSVAVLGASAALAQVAIRKEPVHFKAGESGAAVKGKIKGDETVDYVLGAQKGQSMVVTLEASNGSAYFNVTAPGADEALFIGSTSGSRYEGTLPASGDYTVRLYLMRNAARRGETADYTIRFSVTGAPAKSLSDIYLSPITDEPKAAKGYMGHDRLAPARRQGRGLS